MKLHLSCLSLLLLLSFSIAAEKLFQLKIGPTWPSSLLNTQKKTAWDASIQTGSIIDKRVALGATFDFLWNNDAREQKLTTGIYRVDILQRTFMFPIMGFLAISPAPHLRLSPCISGYIGLNTMYFSYKSDSTFLSRDTTTTIDGNGMYMGLIWKLATDAVLRIGDRSGLFAGVEYQWSKPRKLGHNSDDLYIRRNMSGFGIRFGLRIAN
jgi:hypothetical protein